MTNLVWREHCCPRDLLRFRGGAGMSAGPRYSNQRLRGQECPRHTGYASTRKNCAMLRNFL